jgi:hypothetical protein
MAHTVLITNSDAAEEMKNLLFIVLYWKGKGKKRKKREGD